MCIDFELLAKYGATKEDEKFQRQEESYCPKGNMRFYIL